MRGVKLLDRSVEPDRSALDDNDAVPQPDGFAHVVRNENDCLLEGHGECSELFLQFGARQRIQLAERFVAQQDPWIGGQCPGHPYALPLAAGQLMRKPVRQGRIQPEELEQFQDPPVHAGTIPAQQFRHEPDVACHGEVGEQTHILDHVADRPAQLDGVPLCGRPAEHIDYSRCGREQGVDESQGRRLSRAALTQENDGLAGTHVEIDRPEHAGAVVGELRGDEGDRAQWFGRRIRDWHGRNLTRPGVRREGASGQAASVVRNGSMPSGKISSQRRLHFVQNRSVTDKNTESRPRDRFVKA